MKTVIYKLILLLTAICSILTMSNRSNKYNLRAQMAAEHLTCKHHYNKIIKIIFECSLQYGPE